MQLTIATKIQGLLVTLVMCHSSTVPSVVMRVSFGLNIILGGVFEFGDVDVVIVVVILVSVVAVAAVDDNSVVTFCPLVETNKSGTLSGSYLMVPKPRYSQSVQIRYQINQIIWR